MPAVHRVTPTSVTTRYVRGAHGQDLLDEGRVTEVLAGCGQTLARIHRLGIVHGDYGPQNLLFDPATFETAAILDWEWAHPGEPIEDLAWCEWIVRMHHPEHVSAPAVLLRRVRRAGAVLAGPPRGHGGALPCPARLHQPVGAGR